MRGTFCFSPVFGPVLFDFFRSRVSDAGNGGLYAPDKTTVFLGHLLKIFLCLFENFRNIFGIFSACPQKGRISFARPPEVPKKTNKSVPLPAPRL
ncbi:MAG: hypothetical protein MR438_04635 [Clostridiales bacterium]|nr:hypothetical protein [Clostridiales bacterium]